MLKVALVGCGRIAKRHSELLGHGQLIGAELAAVAAVVGDKAEAIAAPFAVPAFTFFATAEAVRLVGATPMFVDIDENTHNLDSRVLEKAIQSVSDLGEISAQSDCRRRSVRAASF